MSEIRLRAIAQIGKISRELEKAQAHGGKICLPSSGKPKAEQLAEAGISTSTAKRYEQLATNRKSNWRQPAIKELAASSWLSKAFAAGLATLILGNRKKSCHGEMLKQEWADLRLEPESPHWAEPHERPV
jgi:hypothetical protein